MVVFLINGVLNMKSKDYGYAYETMRTNLVAQYGPRLGVFFD